METANVSVVIPTYNGREFIHDALESVFRQTMPPAEIIVVDDCSTDGTPELVESMIPQSPVPLRVIRLETNSGGPARPINVGIDKAIGDIIAVVDQDDVLDSEKLGTEAPPLMADPGLAVAFSFCKLLGSREILIKETVRTELIRFSVECDTHRRLPSFDALRLMIQFGDFVVGYPGFCFRKADWEQKNGVDESLMIASDLEFLAWLFSRADAALIPRVGYFRREHQANLCKLRLEEMHREIGIVIARWAAYSQIRTNKALLLMIGRKLMGKAYRFRKARAYRPMWEMIWLAWRVGESTKRVVLFVSKASALFVLDRILQLPVHEDVNS